MLQLHDDASADELEDLYQYLDEEERVEKYVKVSMKTMDVGAHGESRSAYIVVPQSVQDLKDFIIFQNRTSGDIYEMDDRSVIITEQLAEHLGVGAGRVRCCGNIRRRSGGPDGDPGGGKLYAPLYLYRANSL